MSAADDLIAAWLRDLPAHEARAFNDVSLAMAFLKDKVESLPPSIDRRCRDMIYTKLDEVGHWCMAALQVAVDRADRGQG